MGRPQFPRRAQGGARDRLLLARQDSVLQAAQARLRLINPDQNRTPKQGRSLESLHPGSLRNV